MFFCFSTFSQFHPIISHYKIGSLVMDIVDYEINRYQQWTDEVTAGARKRKKGGAAPGDSDEATEKVKKTLVHR